MDANQLGATSNISALPGTPSQDNTTEPSARPGFMGRAVKGFRNSFRRTIKAPDISATTSTPASARKRSRPELYSALSIDVQGISAEALIRAKVKALATGQITVTDFMSWYEPEQRTAVSPAALYTNFDKIKKQLAKLMQLPEATNLSQDKLALLNGQAEEKNAQDFEELLNIPKKMPDIDEKQKVILESIHQIFHEIKTIHDCLPEEADSPIQHDSGWWPSFDEQREEDSPEVPGSPCFRLLSSPELTLQLHEHPNTYKTITSELTQLMEECETRILTGGRVRPKGFSREECRRFFFACCVWESDDIQLINPLQKVKPQKQAITQLATLICDHFMEESLNNRTSHSWLTTRQDKYRAEAKLARGRCVLEEQKTDPTLLQNIIGRPQGLREDLRLLCDKISELMISRPELMSSRKDIRKKLVKLKTDSETFLGDRIRNKDLLATNDFVISCYHGLRAALRDIPNPPWWSKNWPYLYADYMKASGEEKTVTAINPQSQKR